MLGGSALRSVGLPEAFEGLSLRATVEAMQRRLVELPREISAVEVERSALLRPHVDWLAAAHAALVANSNCSARSVVRRDAARVRRRVLGPPATPGAVAAGTRPRLGATVLVEDPESSPATRRRRC